MSQSNSSLLQFFLSHLPNTSHNNISNTGRLSVATDKNQIIFNHDQWCNFRAAWVSSSPREMRGKRILDRSSRNFWGFSSPPSGLSPSTSPVNTLGMREAVQDREKLKGAVTTQIRSGATELTQCLATQRSVSMQCSVVWPIFQYRAISRALCMKFSTCY